MAKSSNTTPTETPLMRQHASIKAKYPDALLLFRVGDFYETFGEDAVKTSAILGIVLTRRANGAATFIELAGFPHHAIDTYLPKLVKAGLRVAICDQLEDPKLTKTIVKRGVTELVTPGVSYNDKILTHKENNFLAAIHLQPKYTGIAFLDISTGEFYTSQGSTEYIDKLLQSFRPSEVIVQKNKLKEFTEIFGQSYYVNTFDDWVFTFEFGNETLLKHFKTISLKGFGIDELENGIIACGAAMHYLSETNHDRTMHIKKIVRIQEDLYVWLDRFTIRNLELLSPISEKGKCLIDIIDRTSTPMGSRLLKRWIVLPLREKSLIEERHDIVDYFSQQHELLKKLSEQIHLIGDIERLISKVAVGKVNPREVLQLAKALRSIGEVKELISASPVGALKKISEQLNSCATINKRIQEELNPDAPLLISKGYVIADGISEPLDDLRKLVFSGKDYLLQIQQREIENTGISSLRISYNNVFGYYLEVTNTHKNKVPAEWIRKQTLVSSERYITEELKEYEQKILGGEEKILEIEQQLFNSLVISLLDYIDPIQLNSSLIARLDLLLSFAVISKENNYVKPAMNDSFSLDIVDGRHPVIEKNLPIGEEYITNSILLNDEEQQIIILTGPNMSGKSALLRQTALIVLMAQMGCFVPAAKANIGIVDKIFTRVGASDNISSGESTFMVEMNETASILNNISSRSLILLDEIGRGTSTYDGISIAWSIAEYIHNHPLFRPKVLFATHYHELNEMTKTLHRIKNFHVTVKELGNKVLFMRKIAEGGSEHSFGIHVARMAGMPQSVLERAEDLLKKLEQSHSSDQISKTVRKEIKDNYQLSFIQLNDPLLEEIRDDILHTDIDTLTPVEALMKLNEIKRMLNKNKK